ncbi:hypothetical protein AFK24_10960 [Pseudomonas syringae]|uniref:Uncharacterized protein n=1 Tax=Pseudomonas syringae TaxID=317 RepID=A0A1C7ZA06_PSESX|nr:hypothetical protein [Pseudomonas syringae]OCR25015.1 hypothetical protein AFK24_10960 [Pseudomonas syringae]
MDFLWSMFSLRRQYRHYARVDQSGICQAFKRCRQAPAGSEWVEIVEENLSWLGAPLPANARRQRAARRSAAHRLLTV